MPAAAQAQGTGQGAAPTKLYNTVKQKLLDGKQVFGFTWYTLDIANYCEYAKHYDYSWFETQHGNMTFADIEKMIGACPYGATPMIRIPDAQEWQIQHATDIGALGIIVPTVDDVIRGGDAAKWSHFPPMGRRSTGHGQAPAIWGRNGVNYRNTFNDNMLVTVMLETPTAIANAYDIAMIPGIDVLFTGNGDLNNFSGYPPTSPRYQQFLQEFHDAVLKAGKIWGNANWNMATGNPLSKDSKFHQNGPSNDGWKPPEPQPAGASGAPPIAINSYGVK
jgi:2-keto-3-deoxy-L-rhamnonate aldolase RhmA